MEIFLRRFANEQFLLVAGKIPQIARFAAQDGASFFPVASVVRLLLRSVQAEPEGVVHLPAVRPREVSGTLSDVGR